MLYKTIFAVVCWFAAVSSLPKLTNLRPPVHSNGGSQPFKFQHRPLLDKVPPLSTSNCNGGNGADLITRLPGLDTTGNKVPTTQYSGFIQTDAAHNGSLFYWFLEATNPEASGEDIPVLLWLNGGPGASSMTGLFSENGMYDLHDDLTISIRDLHWNEKYHMIFIDNPVGTGFSFVHGDNYVASEDEMGQQFVTALKGFYACHPEYQNNKFYLTGESYAGRYIPFIAKWILNETYSGGGIPLAGLAIGNGLYDPYIQFTSSPLYALMLGIIDTQQYDEIMVNINYCLYDLVNTDPYAAADVCVNTSNNVYAIYGGNIFQYDIRVMNGDAFNDMGVSLSNYLSQEAVQKAIHVWYTEFKNGDGSSEPNPVYEALKYDMVMNNSAIIVKQVLDAGYPIIFYNGQFDGSICNNYGNQLCLNQMNYKGTWIDAPKEAVYRTDSNGNKVAIGYVKESTDDAKILTYFVVSGSGHLVPMNQPYTAKYMIETWIDGTQW